MAATTCMTTIGVFPSREAAERAIAELKKQGYREDQLGLVARDETTSGNRRVEVRPESTGGNSGEGAAIGLGAGMVVGTGVGLAIVAGVIPFIGPALAAGTLAMVLMNASAGAAIGGIAGALIGWGVPEEDARYYENEVKSGRYLLTVQCGYSDDVQDILARHGGITREPLSS